MALFQTPDGKTVTIPDDYDPKTGENNAIKQVQQNSPELQLVHRMVDPQKPDQSIIVPQDSYMHAAKNGLVPKEQYDAEQSAKQSEEKVKSGDINYNPSKTETIPSQFAQGALAQGLPIVQGVLSGLSDPANFSSAFNNEKEATQSALTNQQKTNPITSTLSNIAGGAAATAPLMGGSGALGVAANAAGVGAGYGGVSSGLSDISQGTNQNLGSDIAKGAGVGAAGGLIGAGVAGIAGKAINAISPGVRGAFQEGLSSGQNLSNSTASKTAVDNAAGLPSKITDVIETLQKDIGSQKGHIIGAMDDMGGVDHTPILDSIENAKQQILPLYAQTGFSSQRDAFREALAALSQSKKTLLKNPDSAKALDSVKQVLGNDFIYNDGSLVSSNPATKNILNGVRSDIQHHLEASSENLGGVNAGYKDTLDALSAKGLDKIVPTLSDIESLGSESPSLTSINKLNNLVQYNSSIQSNRFLRPEVKNDLNSVLNSIVDTAQNSKLARTIQGSQTINPLANNAARMKTANSIGANLSPYYNQLPDSIKNNINQFPSIGSTLTKAAIPSTLDQATQIAQRKNNGQ